MSKSRIKNINNIKNNKQQFITFSNKNYNNLLYKIQKSCN